MVHNWQHLVQSVVFESLPESFQVPTLIEHSHIE